MLTIRFLKEKKTFGNFPSKSIQVTKSKGLLKKGQDPPDTILAVNLVHLNNWKFPKIKLNRIRVWNLNKGPSGRVLVACLLVQCTWIEQKFVLNLDETFHKTTNSPVGANLDRSYLHLPTDFTVESLYAPHKHKIISGTVKQPLIIIWIKNTEFVRFFFLCYFYFIPTKMTSNVNIVKATTKCACFLFVGCGFERWCSCCWVIVEKRT